MLFDLVELDANSGTCRGDVLEGRRGRKIECFRKLLDQCIRVESIKQIDVARRTTQG